MPLLLRLWFRRRRRRRPRPARRRGLGNVRKSEMLLVTYVRPAGASRHRAPAPSRRTASAAQGGVPAPRRLAPTRRAPPRTNLWGVVCGDDPAADPGASAATGAPRHGTLAPCFCLRGCAFLARTA